MQTQVVETKVPQTLTTVKKRDDRVVPFNPARITHAMRRCFRAIKQVVSEEALSVYTEEVLHRLRADNAPPTVETIQDYVEDVLRAYEQLDAAHAYINYRNNHEVLRRKRPVPPEVRQAFDESARFFPTQLQQFQFYDKYSRFNYELGRRETWVETVDRAVDFLRELSQNKLTNAIYQEIRQGILEMRVMPSMRLLAMAGPAARRNNAAIYNCSSLTVDHYLAFVECLLISMAGCGVGYSVESRHIEKLPQIKPFGDRVVTLWTVADSAEGWGEALKIGLEHWFNGLDIQFDYSSVRPEGAVLKTKGGRASGPEPLKRMLAFVREKIISRAGGKLRSIDAHDIMCMVGEAAVSGGVRRTAQISLFDFNDEEMRTAKDGDFYLENSQRWNANNSAVWHDGLTSEQVYAAIDHMMDSGRGEPGIFNRDAAFRSMPSWRYRHPDIAGNPCNEILLINQFCNLSSAVCRSDDTLGTLADKVRLATIIGTIQSMATHFPGLRPMWKERCEEERLLGVDLNGHMDCPQVQNPETQEYLRQTSVAVNRHYARILGINPSAAITCVKPSGNSSQLLDCSSGIHARWAPYYIRRVRISASSPLRQVMYDAGVPMFPENGQEAETAHTWVIPFPVKAPEGAITRKDRTAIEQCSYWLAVKTHYVHHNVSCTITYQEREREDLKQWIYEHQSRIGGLSFLPASDAAYSQTPYEECTKEEYERLLAEFPTIDFSKIYRYESDDMSQAAQEIACASGQCDWQP